MKRKLIIALNENITTIPANIRRLHLSRYFDMGRSFFVFEIHTMKKPIMAAIMLLVLSCNKQEIEQHRTSQHKTAGRVADGNKSLLFGGNSYAKVDDANSLKLSAFTLEAWVMPTGAGIITNSGSGGATGFPIITKGRGEDDYSPTINTNYFLALDANRRLVADFEEGAGRNHPVFSSYSLPLSTWSHVAASYNPVSAVWKLYINGRLNTTKDIGSNIYPSNATVAATAIATSFNSQQVPAGYFKGEIDEVRIWNVTKSDADILNNYKLQLSSGTGLAARYAFNENTGTKLSNTATTYNNPQWTEGFDPDLASIAPPVTTSTGPDHIFFVWFENKGYNSIIGNSNAPYINSLINRGTLFTNTYALGHPSQPEYIRWLSGSRHNITTNDCVSPINVPTMWNHLSSAGISMKWVSEGMPGEGSTVCSSYPYVRKHNPMPSFSTIPHYASQPLTYMNLQDLSTFSSLDKVVCITPNMVHDMHDGTVRQGDDWLKANFSKLIDWCMTNNSIFVVYYDESETSSNNRIPVLMLGENVKQGCTIGTHYDHYNWSLTVTSLFGVAKTKWQADADAWANIGARTEVTGWEK